MSNYQLEYLIFFDGLMLLILLPFYFIIYKNSKSKYDRYFAYFILIGFCIFLIFFIYRLTTWLS